MASRIFEVNSKQLIKPPKWMVDNIHYETIAGSTSYGVHSKSSDMDIVGFCIPPKEVIFPHLKGHIYGFGQQPDKFEVYQEHHIVDKDKNQEYDFTVYNIVKYFQLCMENNPNMLDTLFTPQRCVLHSTKIAQMVRDNRHMFLHKGSYHKFRGYALSQMHKIKNVDPKLEKVRAFETKHGIEISDRVNTIDKEFVNRGCVYNEQNTTNLGKLSDTELEEYFSLVSGLSERNRKNCETNFEDRKFQYHVVRLMLECEQILLEHDLDIEKNSEILNGIRNGGWTIEFLEKWLGEKTISLETMMAKSDLRNGPDEGAIRNLLLNCLEEHYGSISEKIVVEDSSQDALARIAKILSEVGY